MMRYCCRIVVRLFVSWFHADVLPITATIDHRYVDGWQIAKLMRAFREYLTAPHCYEPSIIVEDATGELIDEYA